MTPTTPYFVYTPNPFVCDGQSIIPCDLKPGESLKGFLLRHAPHLTEDGWAVSIGGAEVAPAMWGKTFPKEGMHIACRAVLGRQVVQLVAMAALTYFTLGFGAATAGMWGAGAVAGSIGALGALGVYMAGSILINKVLGPKVPKFGETAAAKQVYSLSSQRNSARAYEPIGTLWGEMRVTPDMASQPYTWYEGDDQYLSTILLGGVNVHSVSDLSIGDTPIASYQDVSVYYNGFAGMQSQSLPLYSNADSLAGGELENNGAWVTRTSSAGGIALQVDIEGQLFDVDNKGGILVNTVPLFIESRPVGGAWAPAHSETLSNASTAVLRRTITLPVAAGQHEVRVRLGQPRYNEGDGKDTCKLAWTVLKSIQADTTDYTQFGRIGIKIKATGQFSGSVDTLRATYRAKPMPIWTGTAWATATTRENGLSNPGAIILQTLRGVKHNGKLQFGFGLADEDIDIEGLKAFMLHCAANDYTYDRWVTSEISLMEFCDEVARAGMGEFAWTDGSRPTAMFVAPGQPTSAVVNMANMAKASFSVDYAVASTADGIEYQYVDRARKFETSTIRVNAPGVTTPLNPARITGEGVTTEAHAAKMARFHLGQSLYQYKTINFGANIEHLDYRRLSVLSVSHDLTQWGFGGRVQEVVVGQGFINVRLDEPVPPLATRKLGLRLPGERDYRVWDVTPFTDSQEVLTLVGDWPLEERVPGDGDDNPAHDTLWCYDFKATPGYRVRVVNVEPEKDLSGADITCVPEGPEFWDYVLNGTYVPAPNPSALPQLARPSVQNVRVTEQTNIQGNTRWWQLSAVWESQGAAEYCQVWAGLDGSMLTLVDARATGNRSSWRIEEPGEYLIQVRPFDASGRAGDAISVVYVTAGVAVPPANASNFVVQELAGGLRRFAWSFAGDTPVAFAGVQIRYVAGDTQVSAASWADLTPLGDADDIYTAQFETTKPPAGLYTFALRTINTSGQLSANVLRFAVNLSGSFEQVQQVDLTPPPTPTGFTVGAGISYLFIGCDPQTYSQGRGHLVTRLYGATWTTGNLPVFADATVLAEFQGTVFSHPTNPATTWHLWITWVTRDGVESPTPAGGTNGLVVTSGQDVSSLLDALTGQITQSQLFADLSTRIDLIDGPGTIPGTVAYQVAQEADARSGQLAIESHQRMIGVQDAANAALRAVIGVDTERVDRTADVAAARSELTTNLETGLMAEANQRTLLAAQIHGGYGGNDIGAVTTGLLYQERTARAAQDEALSLQITLLAAGVGEQFDWQTIWYFDQGVDGWSGNGVPTAAQGWLRPANQAAGAYVTTPTGLGVDYARYKQVRLRVRKVGSPVFAGYLWWNALVDTGWDVSRRVAIPEPIYDANGIGTIVVNLTWAVTVDRMRLDLSSAQTATDYFEVDWFAVGRPSPGASTAQMLEEQQARATADTAEATERKTLATAILGQEDPSGATIGNLTQGLIYEEKQARSTADSAMASDITTLGASVTNLSGDIGTLSSTVTTLNEAVANATGTNASTTTELLSMRRQLDVDAETVLRNVLAGQATKEETVASLAVAKTQLDTRIDEGLAAEASARSLLAAKVDTQAAAIVQEQTARATADAAITTSVTTISATANAKNRTYYQDEAPTEGLVSGDLWFDTSDSNKAYRWTGALWNETTDTRVAANTAAIQTEATTRATALAAEATARQTLQSVVEGNTAAIQTEATTRATETGSLLAKYTVKVDVNGYVSGFGLASTANDGTPTSEFTVVADKFSIAPVQTDNAANDGSPFFHRTTPTTINGVAVPAGTYMKAAYIHDATITNAKIANLAVDDAKIANLSVSKLAAGSLAVGQYIQSTGYIAGSAGWRIHQNGAAEFAAASIRGQLTAAQIDTRGLDIKDAAGNVIFSSGSSLGAQAATTYGGGNLCQNSGFDSGTSDKWSAVLPGGHTLGIDLSADWMPFGGHAAYTVQTAGGEYSEIQSYNIPVKVGQRYEYHGKTGAHRCNVAVFIYWVNSDGNVFTNTSLIYNNEEAAGGVSLSAWKHHGGFGVAPAGAVAARFIFRKDTTAAGHTDSYMFATQAYFGEAGADQTTFTPWAPSVGGGRFGALDQITSGNASTYIADLAVNTLQIANNAVTVPTSANAEDTVTITPEGGYVLFAPTINSQGGMTTILVGVSLFASSASLIFGVRVYRNGAFLKEFESSGSANHFATFVLTDVFNGDASYGLFIYKKYSALLDGSVRQRTLIVSGAKR